MGFGDGLLDTGWQQIRRRLIQVRLCPSIAEPTECKHHAEFTEWPGTAAEWIAQWAL